MVGSGLIKQWFCSGSTQKLKLSVVCTIAIVEHIFLSPSYVDYYCFTAGYDQTDEDPNLGKDWFHDSISREEVVDLLTHSE